MPCLQVGKKEAGRDREETETERGTKDTAVTLMAVSGVLSSGVAVCAQHWLPGDIMQLRFQ